MIKPLIFGSLLRLCVPALMGTVALMTAGCADGPGTDTTIVGGTTSGSTGGTTTGETGGATTGATGGTTTGDTGGSTGGSSGASSGGATGGTSGGTNGGTAGGLTGGTSGGTAGGLTGGTSGGATGSTGGGSTGSTGGGTSGGMTCPDGSSDCTTPPPVQCPDGKTFTQIPVGDALVTKVDGNGICIGCSVIDAIDVVDSYTNNFALMTISAGLLNGRNSITVADTKTTFPAGSIAGFVVAVPDAPLLTLDLLQTVNVTTRLNGIDTPDSAGQNALLKLDLLGILNDPSKKFVSAGVSTTPYDAARLTLGGVASVLTQLQVYGAGVCQ